VTILRRLHETKGMRIHTTDGDIGHVHDVYLDDTEWRVRYFHVDTRSWLGGRHVLVAPTIVRSVDWDSGRIHVTIGREDVERCPDIDAHRPVSRQHDVPLDAYVPLLGSASAWEGEELAARLHTALSELRGHEVTASTAETTSDPHLWSARALRGYAVEGDHRDLGHLGDLLVDPDGWAIRYLSVDTGGPLRVNRFLVPASTVRSMSWQTSRILVTLGRDSHGAVAARGA